MIPRRSIWLIFLLALTLGLAFQGSRGLYESTEGRYALCAREMLDSGNFLEPTLLGRPHWTKPPFTYWAIAAGVRLCGRNAWGARLANVLFFALTVLLVGKIGEHLWGRREGLLAALFYATSIYSVAMAYTLSTDTILCFWETLAIFCFWSAEKQPNEKTSRRWILGMWVAFGFAFFTKGPPGLMTLFPVAIFRAVRRRDDRSRGAILMLPGILLFLLVGFWWYALECLRHPGLLGYFLGDEIIRRVATDTFHRHGQWWAPFTMYLPILLGGAGVWSWYFWQILYRQRRWFRHPVQWAKTCSAPIFFLGAWILPPLAVFFISRSRMYPYILPLFPAIILAAAWQAAQHWPKTAPLPKNWRILAVATTLLLLVAKGVGGWMPAHPKDMGSLYRFCQAYDGDPATALIFFDQPRRLGLSFYTRTTVLRPKVTASTPNEAISQLLQSARKNQATQAVLISKHGRDTRRLQELLNATRIVPIKTWGDKHWNLTLIKLLPQKRDVPSPP